MESSFKYNNSSYVSCIKVNGRPILPPLMTVARREEMRYYKQLAIRIEARLKALAQNNINGTDGEVTFLSGNEISLNGCHSCSNNVNSNNSAVKRKENLNTLKNEMDENPVPYETRYVDNVCQTNRPSLCSMDSSKTEGNFQGTVIGRIVDLGSANECLVRRDSDDVENNSERITVVDSESQIHMGDHNSGNVDTSMNSNINNREQNYGFNSAKNSLNSCCTKYKPWENNNESNRILKELHKDARNVRRTWPGSKQPVDISLNRDLAENTKQWLNQSSVVNKNFISPTMKNDSESDSKIVGIFPGTFADREKYALNSNISDTPMGNNPSSCRTFPCCKEFYVDDLLDPHNFHSSSEEISQKSDKRVEKASTPVQNISDKSVETSEDVNKPVKACEDVMNVSKSLSNEPYNNEVRLKCAFGCNSRSGINKCSFSVHNSPENFEFSCSADMDSSMRYSMSHDNLEDSVSSVAMTSSTDLNYYMNITGSSGSVSPGRDVAPHIGHFLKQSSQDGAAITVLQKPILMKPSIATQNLQIIGSSDESGLIYPRNYIINEMKSRTVMDDNTKQDNVNFVEKLFVQEDSPDVLKTSSKRSLTEDIERVDCTTVTTENCDKSHQNPNQNMVGLDEAKCLTVPDMKLESRQKTEVECDNPEISVMPAYIQTDNSFENIVTKKTEGDVKQKKTPPKLVRQNSYTLDSPSPLLVAHVEMQRKRRFSHDMTENVCMSPKPSRKIWDLTKAKSKWDFISKKDNLLPLSPSSKRQVGKKMNCPGVSPAKHAFLIKNKNRLNSSLPSSNTTSPIKLQTPCTSLDCLPSAMSRESVKSLRMQSTPRKSKDDVKGQSSMVTKTTIKSQQISRKDSTKTASKISSVNTVLPMLTKGSPKKSSSETEVSVSKNCKQNLREMILRMQAEHNQQMAQLLAKQRKEQEEMREAFLRQQDNLVQEIHNSYPTVISSPESQKLLQEKNKFSDNVAGFGYEGNNHLGSSFPSVLSNEGDISTSVSSESDVQGKITSSEIHLNKFLMNILSDKSVEYNQSTTECSLYQDLLNNEIQNTNNSSEVFNYDRTQQEPAENSSSLNKSETFGGDVFLPSHTLHSLTAPDLHQYTLQNNNSRLSDIQYKVDLVCDEIPALPPASSDVREIALVAGSDSLGGITNHSSQIRDFGLETISGNMPHCRQCSSAGNEDNHFSVIYDKRSCNRQLFPDRQEGNLFCQQASLSQSEREKIAAIRITAVARGFLTRRLFRTARVQDLILTIRDSLLCAMQLNQDCWPDITVEDVELHRRLIQQVTAACYSLHEVFFSMTTTEKMAIIAADREKIRHQTPRPTVLRPLSAATRRALERKMLQNKGEDNPKSRPGSGGCRVRRIRSAGSEKHTLSSSNYERGQNCFLRQQQESHFQGMSKRRRSANIPGERKPWR